MAIQSLFDTEFACKWTLFVGIDKELWRDGLDGKVQLREDFDKLKSQCDALKNDYDVLKTDFDDLIDRCK